MHKKLIYLIILVFLRATHLSLPPIIKEPEKEIFEEEKITFLDDIVVNKKYKILKARINRALKVNLSFDDKICYKIPLYILARIDHDILSLNQQFFSATVINPVYKYRSKDILIPKGSKLGCTITSDDLQHEKIVFSCSKLTINDVDFKLLNAKAYDINKSIGVKAFFVSTDNTLQKTLKLLSPIKATNLSKYIRYNQSSKPSGYYHLPKNTMFNLIFITKELCFLC
jgi:hypothetical protein